MSLFKNWFCVLLIILGLCMPIGLGVGINVVKENYETSIRERYYEINRRYPDEAFPTSADSFDVNMAESLARDYRDLEKQLLAENEGHWHSFLTEDIIKDVSWNMYDVYCRRPVVGVGR